jgi:hypothetical protein
MIETSGGVLFIRRSPTRTNKTATTGRQGRRHSFACPDCGMIQGVLAFPGIGRLGGLAKEPPR